MRKLFLVLTVICLIGSLGLWARAPGPEVPDEKEAMEKTGKYGESPMLAAMVKAGERLSAFSSPWNKTENLAFCQGQEVF